MSEKVGGFIGGAIAVAVIGITLFNGAKHVWHHVAPDKYDSYCTTFLNVIHDTSNLSVAPTQAQGEQMREAVYGMAALEDNGGPATTVLEDFRSAGDAVTTAQQANFYQRVSDHFTALVSTCRSRVG